MTDGPVLVVNPQDIPALLLWAKSKGYTVEEGPRPPEQVAAALTKVLASRAPMLQGLPSPLSMSALAALYYNEARNACAVGLDFAACLTALSGCEAILRDAVHDACSTTPKPSLIDNAITAELERLALVDVASCARDLQLISADVHKHLTEAVAQFRNPLSHGNGTQFAKRVGGPDSSAPSTVVDLATHVETQEEVTLQERTVIAPMVAEAARRNVEVVLRLIPDLHTHIEMNMANMARPVKFPEQWTRAYREAQKKARRDGTKTRDT